MHTEQMSGWTKEFRDLWAEGHWWGHRKGSGSQRDSWETTRGNRETLRVTQDRRF